MIVYNDISQFRKTEIVTGNELKARRLRLKDPRTDRTVTQVDLAAQLGLNPNTIAIWERRLESDFADASSRSGGVGELLSLALATLERRAGIEEWACLAPAKRAALEQAADLTVRSDRPPRRRSSKRSTGSKRR
jgi:transcriptional regulator with XRE-family HTH domain